MTQTTESTGLAAREELQAWYLDRLRPRLEDALVAGTIQPSELEVLDVQLSDFFEPPRLPKEAA